MRAVVEVVMVGGERLGRGMDSLVGLVVMLLKMGVCGRADRVAVCGVPW